ncbi:MAG TPA: DoxX family membrane protein [Candidatus Thermoplasmatota archaeon]|nr:DoxX family membrane protein [Candidatus Thermoplasmatota archaeon]
MRAMDLVFLLGRLLFGGFFLLSAVNHFAGTRTLASVAESSGVPFPTFAVIATGGILLLGSISVTLGILPRLGLALIGIFLWAVTPIMHAFWMIDDPQQAMLQTILFLRNVALFGAVLALAAMPTPWPLSVGSHLAKGREERRVGRYV